MKPSLVPRIRSSHRCRGGHDWVRKTGTKAYSVPSTEVARTPCSAREIEQVAPAALLGLDDPHVRIEARLTRQIGLDVGLGRGLCLERGREGAIGRVCLVEGGLRRRPVEVGIAVEPVDLDEDRARL